MGCFPLFRRRRRRPSHRSSRQGSGIPPPTLSAHSHSPTHSMSMFSEEDFFDAQESPLQSPRASTDQPNGAFAHHHHHHHHPPDGQPPPQEHEEEEGLFDKLSHWWNTHHLLSPLSSDDHTAASTSHQPHHPHNHHHHPSPSHTPRVASLRRTSSSSIPDAILNAVPPDRLLEPDLPPSSVGCISFFGTATAALAHKRFLRLVKPRAGGSMKRVDVAYAEVENSAEASIAAAAAAGVGVGGGASKVVAAAWEEPDATTFNIRSEQYMKTKEKINSEPSVYQLIGVDMYSFDFKIFHIAQHVELPQAPVPVDVAKRAGLPPLLIVNLQLPTYVPSLFGVNDGPGHSLVYYFVLPEGWKPEDIPHESALKLLQRFFGNGREFDGQPTRDRFKLIGRVVNPDEWAEKGPLSNTELRLLRNYNEKPLLTRPQQRFYTGNGYLEIDLDVHSYAYIAKRAFASYMTRLAPVIFENAFVVQGNRVEELPEIVLGAGRVYRVDFTKSSPFPAKSLDEIGNGSNPDPISSELSVSSYAIGGGEMDLIEEEEEVEAEEGAGVVNGKG